MYYKHLVKLDIISIANRGRQLTFQNMIYLPVSVYQQINTIKL